MLAEENTWMGDEPVPERRKSRVKATSVTDGDKMPSVVLKGYADYGDYWRGNYETMAEGKYNYTRDELMEDVHRIYLEVWFSPCMFF